MSISWGFESLRRSPSRYQITPGFPRGAVVKYLPANAGDAGDTGLIPGLGKSPGGGNGNPLHYSCQDNPMDRGAWKATVHGVAGVGHNWPHVHVPNNTSTPHWWAFPFSLAPQWLLVVCQHHQQEGRNKGKFLFWLVWSQTLLLPSLITWKYRICLSHLSILRAPFFFTFQHFYPSLLTLFITWNITKANFL